MKQVLISFLVGALVGAGIYGLAHKTAPAPEQVVGASASPQHYNQEYFYNGLSYSKLTAQTFGVSTTTPAAFGSAASGFFTISSGATSFSASSTAIDTNTDINLSQVSTSSAGSTLNPTLLTQLGNVTCNTNPATSTPVVSVYTSSTNPTLNGFVVKLGSAPQGSPLCFSWSAQGY